MMAANLSDMAQILSRVLETVSRLEGNQQTLIAQDGSTYQQLHVFLVQVQREVTLISTRQMHIASYVDRLTHIEALLDSATHLIRHVASAQSGQMMAVAQLAASAAKSAPSAPPPEKPWVHYAEKAIELGKLIASNWGPIAAGIVATYAWGLPYLRQLLGSH